MRKSLLIGFSILCICSAGAWYYLSASGNAQTQILETTSLKKGSVEAVLEATGIIKPEVGAIVKTGTRATGLIKRMYVRVGDKVTQGQLIAEIDDREHQAQLTEAEARFKKARAERDRITTVYPLQIKEAKAQLKAAKAEATYLQLSLTRKQQLVKKKLDSQDSLDDARQKYDVAQSTLKARSATLKRLTAEYALEKVKAKEAVTAAEADLQSIQVRITYTTIHAPIDGIVSQVAAQEGETVVAGLEVANLITILDPSRLEMWIYIDETDVGQIKPEMNVAFRVDAFPDKIFHGTVNQIYPQPEIRDNIVYYQALVRLTQKTTQTLRPEMTTQCTIVVEKKENVLALPNKALKWVGEKQFVFVQQDDGSIRRVSPTFGLTGFDTTEVLSGLKEGDTIATKLELPKEDKKEW